VILVARADSTTRSAVVRARAQLQKVGTNLVGGVLNAFEASKARTYPYSYSYTYRYAYEYTTNGDGEPNGSGRGESARRRGKIPT